MIYPRSRVIRQRLAREQRVQAERRRQQLIDQLARDDDERVRFSQLTLAELIITKNTQPTLFDQPKENQ